MRHDVQHARFAHRGDRRAQTEPAPSPRIAHGLRGGNHRLAGPQPRRVGHRLSGSDRSRGGAAVTLDHRPLATASRQRGVPAPMQAGIRCASRGRGNVRTACCKSPCKSPAARVHAARHAHAAATPARSPSIFRSPRLDETILRARRWRGHGSRPPMPWRRDGSVPPGGRTQRFEASYAPAGGACAAILSSSRTLPSRAAAISRAFSPGRSIAAKLVFSTSAR